MPTAVIRVVMAVLMMVLVVGAVAFAARPAIEGRAAPRLRAAS